MRRSARWSVGQDKQPNRREFMRGCAALGMAAFASGIEQFARVEAVANAQTIPDYKALVGIFLFGGNDGNNMIVPLDAAGYAAYSAVRSAAGLAIPQASLLPITPPSLGRPFGLHPNLPELQALWNQQKLAAVCNVGPLVQPLTRAQYQSGIGRPQQLFSHSDQQVTWQTSRPDTRSPTGWGGRVADKVVDMNPGSFFPLFTSVAGNSAVFGLGQATRPLGIAPAPTPLNQLLVLSGFNTSPESVARRSAMDAIRDMDRNQVLIDATSEGTQQGLDIGQAFSTDPVVATAFPNTTLGNQLKQVAKLIKLNQTSAALGLHRQMFFCSLGGFDTHSNQPAGQVSLLAQLSQAMNAFYAATVELGLASQITTFTLSDFGRTLAPSGTGGGVGTDHAWGNHHFVMGGAVRGGEFYGVPGPNGTVFPTLQLSGPNDTDSRGRWIPTAAVDQYAGTMALWFGVTAAELPGVFPLIGRFTAPTLGFMI
jgi:uncharacterized protein (DUF1501 family)